MCYIFYNIFGYKVMDSDYSAITVFMYFDTDIDTKSEDKSIVEEYLCL